MTQTNLLEYNPDDDHPIHEHDALQDAMRKQWADDLDVIHDRGIIPDWIGEPSPLSKDKARLLELLYDCGCVTWSNNPGPTNRDTTASMGFKSQANAKACIDACLRDGLVVSRLYRGNMVFEMSMAGEFALDEFQLDRELGIL